MDNLITIGTYVITLGLALLIVYLYLRRTSKKSNETIQKIEKAKEFGLYEPVTLHPVIDDGMCIGSAACIEACPEKDILGIVSGKAKTINASRCVGHGACFNACPVQAISLCIGTEKRGVDLPHLSQEFETNVPMMFIAGELGGMGLIKNAVEQGKQTIDAIAAKINRNLNADYDVAIIGAGPAGISTTLSAVKNKLSYITFEQDSLGGTVYHFPRTKLVMTSPMELPLYGKIKLKETSKAELLSLWQDILVKNQITINEFEKVLNIQKEKGVFTITTSKGTYTVRSVVVAIGRRGTPRKLGVPGEEKEKVYYRLIEPELIQNQKILVVGGGDSAIEAALLLHDEGNTVTLSYRGDAFTRLKSKNLDRITAARDSGNIKVVLNSQVIEIKDTVVSLTEGESPATEIPNDLVYVLIGGELPNQFLNQVGISISKKFGQVLLSHRKN